MSISMVLIFSIPIAKKFGTTADKIKQLNNLNNNILSVGQEIVIPSVALSEVTIYKVQSGDNLYDLAKKFGTSVSELKDLNNLKSDSLSINQELKVPAVNIGETTYTVKSGDSLYSIAKKFNTTVSELKQLNDLTTDFIQVGQMLYISSPTSSTTYKTYTVVKGDTIFMGNNE